MSFLKNIIKESKNEFASIVDEGIEGSDIKGFVDTGSYAFNALLSGSLHGACLTIRSWLWQVRVQLEKLTSRSVS
jgi:hypothetical protein